MDFIFDIDGTLADATHRLHFIQDEAYWIRKNDGFLKPDWGSFLAVDLAAKDTAIAPVWEVLLSLLDGDNRIIFITGRRESQREMTTSWLLEIDCPFRTEYDHFCRQTHTNPVIYMRSNGDLRPSSVVKREGLIRARGDGYDPKLVFEDRKDDTAMWRSEGLVCCQVAEGNY